jgi:hypothetical protein
MGLNHQERVELAKKTAAKIRELHPATKQIYLHGSVAHNQDDKESDVDLLVTELGEAPDGDLTYTQLRAWYDLITSLDPNEFPIFPGSESFLDVCCISSQHFDRPPLKQKWMVWKIKKYGQEL